MTDEFGRTYSPAEKLWQAVQQERAFREEQLRIEAIAAGMRYERDRRLWQAEMANLALWGAQRGRFIPDFMLENSGPFA